MKENLLQYPNKWSNLLNLFRNCFTIPQFDNFCLLATSMAVSHYSTINRFSELYDKNQSTLNRFLTESPWEDYKVRDRLSKLTVTKFKDCFLGVIDDTLSHKPYAKKMEGIASHYDSLTDGYCNGHSIVTCGLHSLSQGLIPFDEEIYIPKQATKNEIASYMIERLCRFKKPLCFVVDTWYANDIVISKLKQKGIRFVTQIKSNRNVNINRKKRYVREHEKHIKEKQFEECYVNNELYRAFSCDCFIHSIGNVKLVFTQKYDDEEKKWGETHYLITDMLSISDAQVIELYLRRGGIESFHREAKQHIGLESYQLRRYRGIERYLFLVLLVYALLLLLNKQLLEESMKSRTIGELKCYLKEELYTTLLKRAKYVDKNLLECYAHKLAVAI